MGHSETFTKAELAKGDQMVRGLMAEGIHTVAALYRDGILVLPPVIVGC